MGRVMTTKDFEAAQPERPVRLEVTEDVKVRGVGLKKGDQFDATKFEANTLLGLKRAKLAAEKPVEKPTPAKP